MFLSTIHLTWNPTLHTITWVRLLKGKRVVRIWEALTDESVVTQHFHYTLMRYVHILYSV